MIMRGIVVLAVLSVFVAGCSQSSESQTQDAGEIESAVASVPAASFERPSGSIEIDSDMRENQEVGGASTSATSPYESAIELPGEIVDMIETTVNSCDDILKPRCSVAAWNVCDAVQAYWKIKEPEEQQEWIDWTDEQKRISEAMRILCLATDMVYLAELASVLSSKYEDEYFALEHFSSFRNLLYDFEDISLTKVEANTEEDKSARTFDLSEEITNLLIQFTEKINDYYESEKIRIGVRIDEEAMQILDFYGTASETLLCPDLALEFLEDLSGSEEKMERCIEDVCSSNSSATICSPSHKIDYVVESDKLLPFITNLERLANTTLLETSTIGQIEIYWTMMPFVCANTEIRTSSPSDKCRQLAALICDELANYSYDYVGSTHLSRIKNSACALGRHYSAWPRILARRACFESVAELRMSPSSIFDPENYCALEMQECENNSSAYYDDTGRDSYVEGQCGILSQYYDLEILWKRLPSVCFDDANNSFSFIESSCLSAIENLCYYEIDDNNLAISRVDRSLPSEIYYRYVYDIRRATCHLNLPMFSYLSTDYISGLENLDSLILLNSPVEIDILELLGISSSPDVTHFDVYSVAAMQNGIILNKNEMLEERSISNLQNPAQADEKSNLTISNLNSITETSNICASADQSQINSDCSSALWSSCYNVRAEASDRENPESEVSNAIAYLCSAAYIAEIAELSAALSANFPNDYDNGSFDEFNEFILERITKKPAYFALENTEIQVSSDLANKLPDDVLPALQSIGESLGQLVRLR